MEARSALDVSERLGAPPWRIADHRGLIEESLENQIRAREHYEEALRIEPDFVATEMRRPPKATSPARSVARARSGATTWRSQGISSPSTKATAPSAW